MKQVEQLMVAASKEKLLKEKTYRIQLIVLGRIGRIYSMDIIFLVLWLQIHIVFALNLWSDIIVSMVYWLFLEFYHWKWTKLVPVTNLRLLRYVLSVLYLRLSPKKNLQVYLRKKAKAVVLPLQPTELMLSSICMLKVTPNPLSNLK